MKKFGASLSNEEMRLARKIEAAGLASISQIVKAMERGEEDKIAAWKAALEPKQEAPKDEPQPEEQAPEQTEETQEAESSASTSQPFTWTETQTGYLTVETFETKTAAVVVSQQLSIPSDAFQDEDGWHLFSRWNPTVPRNRGGARPGAGRKHKPEKFDERSYNAGYQAGLRKRANGTDDPNIICPWCHEPYESGHRKDCTSPMAPSWPEDDKEEEE